MESIKRQKQVLENLLSSADEMAAAASVFGAHGNFGYESFVRAREKFVALSEELNADLDMSLRQEISRQAACAECYKRVAPLVVI